MKILAVRGEGLASLARPFEIDLEAEPLRGAGVFAIVGPTGAGKSTLLDAICLALFDRTPRLAGRGPRLGGEDDRDGLSSRDPRHVLRRGVPRAVAEVDFRGIDGRAYRSRWEVRRARGKADGKIQDATIGLVDLETERAVGGHTKKETLAEIEARLGLSFAQMTRAVLLAQGEFAAFLQAEDRERAELLERMTGTEIYGLVSMEAARRARDEKALEARLLERACLVDVMDPVARAELEAKLPEQRLDVVRRAARTRDLERQARWWADLDLFAREEDDARRELAELDGQLGLAEARRRELEELGRAESVRGELEAVDRGARLAAEAEGARARAERALADARERGAAAQAEVGTAERARREAEDALAVLTPRLARARELDRARSIAVERASAAQRRLADRAATVASRRQALEALEATRAHHDLAAAGAEAERRARAAVDALHDVPPGEVPWAERIERARALLRARIDTVEQLASARAAIGDRERALAAEREETSRWSDALARAEHRVQERRAALAREPAPDAVRSAIRRLLSSREALARALEHATRAELAAAREDEHARAVDAGARAEEDARSRAARLELELASIAPALGEAERACELARAQLQLAERRADLRDGEECPLCGATDHPFARHAPMGRLLDALEARALELRTRMDAARGELARAEAGSESASRTLAWALREQGRAERERQEARAASEASLRAAELEAIPAWSRGLDAPLRAIVAGVPAALATGVAASVGEGGAGPGARDVGPSWMSLAVGVAGDRLSAIALELDAARARLESALERREAAEVSCSLAIEERERATAAHAEADRSLRRAETSIERDRARVAALERETERLDGELAALEARSEAARAALGWAGAPTIGAAAEASLDRLAAALADTASARRRETLARTALASLSAPLAEAERAEALARTEHTAAAREVELAAGELDSIEGARAALLLEDPTLEDPDGAERDHRARLEASREAHAAALAGAARARQALEDAERAERAARARSEEIVRELHGLRAVLVEALARASIEEGAARAALARPKEEVAAWRRDLDALDARRARARAVLEERAGRRERHAAEPPATASSRADLDAEVAKAREQEDAARRLVVGAEQWLERDEHARGARDELLAELDAQRERVRTWTILESLIGSSDGKRFRVFAQGLTLDLLLSTANHQLERIAPRYALRRAPAGELAIQVIDREMGDEVRGVHGLSGGETFLVSLALALALASIAARRVPVGSLFVDEGFGGLDGESLEVALAALDALQASGRQVGVISHVPAIAERFAARIEVSPCGHAESVVRVVG